MNISTNENQKKYRVYYKKLLTKKINIITNNYSEAKIVEKLIKYKF